MKRNFLCTFLVVACVLISSLVTSAHHGYAAYDTTKTVALKGTVTQFSIENPHSSISFDAKDDTGNLQHWIVETGHVRAMKEGGWTTDSLKPGDQVTFYFHAAKNGTPRGVLVKVVWPNGQELPHHSENGN